MQHNTRAKKGCPLCKRSHKEGAGSEWHNLARSENCTYIIRKAVLLVHSSTEYFGCVRLSQLARPVVGGRLGAQSTGIRSGGRHSAIERSTRRRGVVNGDGTSRGYKSKRQELVGPFRLVALGQSCRAAPGERGIVQVVGAVGLIRNESTGARVALACRRSRCFQRGEQSERKNANASDDARLGRGEAGGGLRVRAMCVR